MRRSPVLDRIHVLSEKSAKEWTTPASLDLCARIGVEKFIARIIRGAMRKGRELGRKEQRDEYAAYRKAMDD